MMIRLFATCLFFTASLIGQAQTSQVFYVSPSGNDAAEGSMQQPLFSPAAALRKARNYKRTTPNVQVKILFMDGIYRLVEPLVIRPEDSGEEGAPTILEAAPGASPVFSGAIALTQWVHPTKMPSLTPSGVKSKLLMAQFPANFTWPQAVRQCWVNGHRAQRAASTSADHMQRILSWNKKEASCTIPNLKGLDQSFVPGLEFFIHQWWAIAQLRVKEVQSLGDSLKLFFQQPESKIQSEHPWPAPWISPETGNSPFRLVNSPAFLDQPGEFYYEATTGRFFYYPLVTEKKEQLIAEIPILEQLLVIGGNEQHPVHHVELRGITFQHSDWQRPGLQGHVPHQVGLFMTEAYKLKPSGTPERPGLDNQAWIGRPSSAVSVSHSRDITIEDCRFEHLSSTGIDFSEGILRNNLQRNLFIDIGGNAVLAGLFSEVGQEIHQVFNPPAGKLVCDSLSITENLIRKCGTEDWGAAGIAAGYVRNCQIEGNDLGDLPYMGISLGWGWNPAPNYMQQNKVVGNRIHHYGKYMYDVAGIYTLSCQPGTLIAGNWVDSIYRSPYAHLPQHWFYLYCDEGSSGITVKNNYSPAPRYLQNANGPNNHWKDNGASQLKVVQAGLSKSVASPWSAKDWAVEQRPINEDRPLILECIDTTGKPIDESLLRNLLARSMAEDSNALYQWKNHTVIFTRIPDVYVFRGRVNQYLPTVKVRIYEDLFYEYNRTYCGEEKKAGDWTHVIISTNLVKDVKKQKEYLRYHANQFRDWPEIAKGFCKADFQQLLLFRKERQLMLVISIPKGETLAHLNPRTTENNPRVDEWNRLMANYQEALEGANTTWIELEKIKQ